MAKYSHDDISEGESEELEDSPFSKSQKQSKREWVYKKTAQAFYPFYSKLFWQRKGFISSVERSLIQATRSEPVDIYLSAYLGFGALFGGLFSLVVVAMTLPYYNEVLVWDGLLPASGAGEIILAYALIAIGTILVTLSLVVSLMIIGGLAGVLIASKQQITTIRKRRAEIEILLPDAVAFMYSLSTGNMNRIDIIRALARSKDTFGEVSIEFQRIVHSMDSFSDDYHTAIGNVSETTPSPSLATFLNDMLSTITSGGKMDDFLKSQKESFQTQVKQTQKAELDRLEFFNELYITMSVVPVVFIILAALASAIGVVGATIPALLVYIMIPTIQIFALLIVISIFENSYGSGKLRPDEEYGSKLIDDNELNIFSAGIAGDYKGVSPMFDKIYINELRSRLVGFLSDPLVYIRRRPEYVLWVTIPIALLFFISAILTGNIGFSIDYLTGNSFTMTLVGAYIPIMIIFAPFVYFYEHGLHKRGKITDGLTNDLNKLANTNEQGITLRKSMLITAQDSDSLLSQEFRTMYKKQDFGIPLSRSIIETNNKYSIPRLARLFRIILSAQGISNNITEVLKTASSLSETQDKIISDRKSQTRQQITVVIAIFFIFVASLVVMQTLIIERIVDYQSVGSSSIDALSGDSVSIDTISLMFYHGAILQGTLAGFICGYIRTGEYSPGLKYVLAFFSFVMGVWYVF